MTDSHPRAIPPVVMVIAGNDPSGGAGIAADLQAVSTLGCHPAPVITAITVQDTSNAYRVVATDPELVTEQARAVLSDMTVSAVKIGLLPTVDVLQAVADLLSREGSLPIVLDPVLIASGGAELAEDAMVEALLDCLLPLATVVTPNAHEIRRLAGEAGNRDSRARKLLESGCRYVLAKGADEDTPGVENALYGANGFEEIYRWRRLPNDYHGSGCTLAAALAALLASGKPVPAAVAEAQRYTRDSLVRAFRPGQGQWIPQRTQREPEE
ncbi:MAG: bifunctional hydroxymethylpyrimidine kinase/phosphomethylpyrimidine kinase [Gammaproteobacteria bacterium]